MKKLLGSVVTVLSVFVSSNAMKINTTTTFEQAKSHLFQAIKDRNLPTVFTTIAYAHHDSAFFASLSTADNYWLLLATFNNHHTQTCGNVLLRNMHAVFGYETNEEFCTKHRYATAAEYVKLLINLDAQRVINCATTYELETIKHIILDQREELIKKGIPDELLDGLKRSIKYTHSETFVAEY